MSYSIVFSLTAVDTFDSIKSQLLEKWGSRFVIKLEKRTLEVLEIISKSPFIFQGIKQAPNIRKGFIHKNCSMFYEVKEDRIEILFFWDNRQDPLV